MPDPIDDSRWEWLEAYRQGIGRYESEEHFTGALVGFQAGFAAAATSAPSVPASAMTTVVKALERIVNMWEHEGSAFNAACPHCIGNGALAVLAVEATNAAAAPSVPEVGAILLTGDDAARYRALARAVPSVPALEDTLALVREIVACTSESGRQPFRSRDQLARAVNAKARAALASAPPSVLGIARIEGAQTDD